jgi:purine-binding chemotaxis protein CheW
MEKQLVIFQLGQEYFGVAISAVESIIKLQAITHVPNTPRFVEGVTNLRGKILPVIDLRKRLNLPAGEATKESRIIVVALGEVQAGMVVDAVTEVLTIAEDAVEPAPRLATTVDSTFITGIAKITDGRGQRLVILIDLARVLDRHEVESLVAVA